MRHKLQPASLSIIGKPQKVGFDAMVLWMTVHPLYEAALQRHDGHDGGTVTLDGRYLTALVVPYFTVLCGAFIAQISKSDLG